MDVSFISCFARGSQAQLWGVWGRGSAEPGAKLSWEQWWFSSIQESSRLELQPCSRVERRMVLAVVKEEGLECLGGARARRSLEAEETGSKVQKRSWRGNLKRGKCSSCAARWGGIDEEAPQHSLAAAGCCPMDGPSFAACWEGAIPALPQLPSSLWRQKSSCSHEATVTSSLPSSSPSPVTAGTCGPWCCRGGSSRAHGTAGLGRGSIRVSPR